MSVAYNAPGSGGGGFTPMGKVNLGGWISEAWELFKANAGIWIVAALALILVPQVVNFVVGLLGGAASSVSQPAPSRYPAGFPGGYGAGSNPMGSILGTGVSLGLQLATMAFDLAWRAFLYGGVYRMAVKQVRGEPITFGDIFAGGQCFFPMLLFEIIYGLATLVGLLLCIVPCFLVTGLLFPCYALIADGVPLGEALSRSVDGMKRDLWGAAGFIFVMGLLILASFFAFCLGEFVTIPMSWLVAAIAYRDMIGMPGRVAAGAGAFGTPVPGVWPPPPSAGQAPPSPFGQPPPPTAYGQPPPAAPRRSLSGDLLDESGNVIPPPSNPNNPNNPPPPAA